MKKNPITISLWLICLITLLPPPTKQACLTKEQLTFLGFEKLDTPETSDKEICKSMLTGNQSCVSPGKIQSVIETKLTELKEAIRKQIDLTINNFWNIMGRWDRLYNKIKSYKADNKWSVKHVVMNTNMVNRAEFAYLKYNKVRILILLN
jgi:hypothetical protein